MVFPFDFVDFADQIAGNCVVKDAWGKEVNVRNVELILTTSMVKLWDSYDSCEDYLSKSYNNGYTFCVTKTAPEELENSHSTNYQFIQSLNLTDEDIDDLIEPTVKEFEDILSGDWRKTLLFLKGANMNDRNVLNSDNDFIKALMIDPEMMYDPFVRSSVFQMIRKKINQAKVGVINVHGNYSIVSGDPYLLCQSIFGLQLTGLLKAGEIYNEYWGHQGSEKLVCFRAPMSTQENIRSVRPVFSDTARYWYQYIHTCTIFNSWDTAAAALNGMD